MDDELDLQSHFPMQETFEDFAGRQRVFTIDCYFNGIGFTVRAREHEDGVSGYEFGVYSETSWSAALGRLRGKIQRRLATRYLTTSGGTYDMLHDALNGRITSGDAGVAVVVDGVMLEMEDLSRMLSTYQGWEFELKIVDPLE